MFGLSERPLQTRQGLLFSFSAYLQFLSAAFLRVETHWFSPPWIGRCPGFVHNWPTRLQQGLLGTSVVLLPYPAPKTAHRATRGGEFVFLPKTSLPLPQRGRGWVSLFLGLLGLLCSFTNGSHGSNSACLGLRWCRFPYPAPKTAHRGTQGRGWFHRLFLVRFFCGSPANCRSRW